MFSKHLLALFLLFQTFQSVAQNPRPAWRNYTTDHGLPSQEVHDCLEGPDGYMWFATDNGLSRFDGYTFKNYGLQEGLKDLVVFDLQLDSKERIWMSTLSGSLYYLEQDSIRPFVGNRTIRENGWTNPKAFLIGKKDELILNLLNIGLVIFDPSGDYQIIKSKTRLGGLFLYRASVGWIVGNSNPVDSDSLMKKLYVDYLNKNFFPPIEMHYDTGTVRLDFKMPYNLNIYGEYICTNYFDDLLVLQIGGTNCLIQNGKNIYQWETKNRAKQKAVLPRADSSILCGFLDSDGLHYYRNMEAWKNERSEQWLPEKSITNVLEDGLGGIWVGTLEHGVFYCPNTELKIYDRSSGLPGNQVSAIAPGIDNEIFIGFRNGRVSRLNKELHQINLLPEVTKQPIYDMVFDREEKTLWISYLRNAYFKDKKWNIVTYLNPVRLAMDPVIGKKLTLRPGSSQLWGGHYDRFGMVDIRRKAIGFNSFEANLGGRTFVAMEALDDRIWIGRPQGLFEFRDSQLLRPEPFFPQFETRIDDLANLSDGTLAIATKGNGLLLWKDSILKQFGIKEGLNSNTPKNLHVDDRDRIWVGTNKGLNFLNRENGGPWKVENMTIAHGLPSNVITDIKTTHDEIWVATDNGLVRFPDQEKKVTPSPQPRITAFQVGLESIEFDEKPKLNYDQNNVTIRFVTLNFPMKGNIPYRFRVDQGDWTITQNTSVNFPSLSFGNRLFEVQSQNEDGIWSDSTSVAFFIATPWWRTPQAILAFIMVLAAGIIGFFKYRTGILQKELSLQKQLTEIERQALRSQMNPHFIFNSLNAIQGYIATGDKLSANRYLSRFSKLIRSALQHSRMTKVFLEDDLTALRNYVQLEQMRFENKFDFQINVNENIDPGDITIPPLLIQPFVENAIVHGIAKKEGKGQIEVTCLREGTILKVIIQDNGIGIEASKKLKRASQSSHKSVGMTITKRRLEMLSGNGDAGQVQMHELKTSDGQSAGTQVIIRIPI